MGYGINTKLSPEDVSPISRGVPTQKAMQEETLIALKYEEKIFH